MDKQKLLTLLRDEKVQDYTFTIFFFLVFSVFVLFAIRPNILTAFSLQRELQELKLKNREAEEVILQIVNYQSVIENYRDKLPLLDEAVPSSPGLARAAEEVRLTAASSGLVVEQLTVDSITFSDEMGTGELETYSIALSSTSSSEQMTQFIQAILNQRRLKIFDSLSISAGSDGTINVSFQMRTYYL